MSSLRNAIPRRPHRERAQPNSRAKYGLLEKHKDYSLRARDFNAKKARLRLLRQKAVDRNPDEFSFSMVSSRVDKDGVKIADRGNNKGLRNEVVRLLKTQDAGYLRTSANATRRERERLEQEIQILGDGKEKMEELRTLKGGRGGKHLVFVDDVKEQGEFDAENWFKTDEKGLARSFNRPRLTAEPDVDDGDGLVSRKTEKISTKKQDIQARKEQRAAAKKHERTQERMQARLKAVKDREQQLRLAEQELNDQRAKMNNSIGGTNRNSVKFKIRQRKT